MWGWKASSYRKKAGVEKARFGLAFKLKRYPEKEEDSLLLYY
jgi:hypothetical protein